jgi:hypothetical protein
MQLTRRKFATTSAKIFIAIFALGSSAMLGGCSAVSDLEAWIPVALSAVSSIVKLLGPVIPAPVATIITLIQAGFSALLTAIQNYKSGGGLLSDISAAIAAIESSFQQFFASLNVPSGLLSLIEGLAGVILSTIEAFAAEISPSPAPAVAARLSYTTVQVAPVKRSVKTFKRDFNQICKQYGHAESELK